MMRDNRWLDACALSALALLSASAFAQDSAKYPNRSIRMVVPFAPGGASDFVGRIISPKLTDVLGEQVVVDNRGGAAGNIGVELAARAVPDGYTILLGNVGTCLLYTSPSPRD